MCAPAKAHNVDAASPKKETGFFRGASSGVLCGFCKSVDLAQEECARQCFFLAEAIQLDSGLQLCGAPCAITRQVNDREIVHIDRKCMSTESELRPK